MSNECDYLDLAIFGLRASMLKLDMLRLQNIRRHCCSLQVLVSIQGLVLVPEPYYNEAGYSRQVGGSFALLLRLWSYFSIEGRQQAAVSVSPGRRLH